MDTVKRLLVIWLTITGGIAWVAIGIAAIIVAVTDEGDDEQERTQEVIQVTPTPSPTKLPTPVITPSPSKPTPQATATRRPRPTSTPSLSSDALELIESCKVFHKGVMDGKAAGLSYDEMVLVMMSHGLTNAEIVELTEVCTAVLTGQ